MGQRNGLGTFYYSNGSKYEGEWCDNLKHGQGTFTFEDGTTYVGPFEKDRMVNRSIPPKEAANLSAAMAEIGDSKKKGDAKKGNQKTQAKANETKKPDPKAEAKDKNQNTSTSGAGKSFPISKSRREVEDNPYKKLIDISDLMELEGNPDEVLKEVQNVLLRHNSELKSWYRDYSRKIEATKSEESFAMSLRQVWRFLRDTHLVSANSTLAQFNRLYNAGVKNHFTLLGSKDKEKFDIMYEKTRTEMEAAKAAEKEKAEKAAAAAKSAAAEKPAKADLRKPKNQGQSLNVGGPDEQEELQEQPSEIVDAPAPEIPEVKSPVAAQAPAKKKFVNISDDEDEDEQPTPGEGEQTSEVVEPEDTHDAMKIVLQRQFFEAITRAAAVKFASGIGCANLPNLAVKLNHLFDHNMKPLAVKNRSKSVDQVKEWRLAEKVFEADDYHENLLEVFRYFSSKEGNTCGGRRDETLTFQELLDMLRRAKLLQEVGATPVKEAIQIDDGEGPVLPAEISTKDVIFAVERYYDPKDTLASKICDDEFEKYLAANPMLLRVNQEAEAKRLQEEERKREEQAKLDAGEGSGAEAAEASQEPEEGQGEDPLSEGALNARAEAERQEIRAAWEKQLISAHLVYIKGVELVFYEFKELLLELAN